MKEKIELGATYKDVITGFEGVATGRAEYISGCSQVLIAPSLSKDGSFRESHWFDEQRLQRVGSSRIALDNGSTPGPDKAAPRR